MHNRARQTFCRVTLVVQWRGKEEPGCHAGAGTAERAAPLPHVTTHH